jgi:hypothetical protein
MEDELQVVDMYKRSRCGFIAYGAGGWLQAKTIAKGLIERYDSDGKTLPCLLS